MEVFREVWTIPKNTIFTGKIIVDVCIVIPFQAIRGRGRGNDLVDNYLNTHLGANLLSEILSKFLVSK